MILIIDIKNKTITLKEKVDLHSLFEELEALLPDGKWQEFELIPHIDTITVTYPVQPVYPICPTYPDPMTPVYPPNPGIWYYDQSEVNVLDRPILTLSNMY